MPAICFEEMPLEGHVLVGGFGVRSSGCLLALGAIQLQDGFRFTFVGVVLDAVLFVFAAPELAFDLDVGSFLEGGGEVCKLLSPDRDAVPFGVGLPFASLVFPGSLGGDGENGNRGSVGGEPFGCVLTDEANESESIVYVELGAIFLRVFRRDGSSGVRARRRARALQ